MKPTYPFISQSKPIDAALARLNTAIAESKKPETELLAIIDEATAKVKNPAAPVAPGTTEAQLLGTINRALTQLRNTAATTKAVAATTKATVAPPEAEPKTADERAYAVRKIMAQCHASKSLTDYYTNSNMSLAQIKSEMLPYICTNRDCRAHQ